MQNLDLPAFSFAVDRNRLEEVRVSAIRDEHDSVLAAAAALAAGDSLVCLQHLGGESALTETVLGRVCRATALYAAGRFFEAREATDRAIAALGPAIPLILLKSACLEHENRPWAAVEVLVEAARSTLGLAPAKPITGGPAKRDILGQLALAPRDLLKDAAVTALGRNLSRLGAFESDRTILAPVLIQISAQCVARPDLKHDDLERIATFLGLAEIEAPEWQDDVFAHFIVPTLQQLVSAGRGEMALLLEQYVYNRYIKTRENADHFDRCYTALAPLLRAAGMQAARNLAPSAVLVVKPNYRVALIAPQLSDVAHVHAAIDICTSIQRHRHRRLDCTLVGITGIDDAVRRSATKNGLVAASLQELAAQASNHPNLLVRLAEYLRSNAYDAAVWISAAPYCAYAFALPLAPVQIFLAMKYHGFTTPDVDGYLTGGAPGENFRAIDGRQWRVGLTSYSDLVDTAAATAAAAIRDQLGRDRIILGCFGRREKLESPPFIETVTGILQRHPEALFLWTGREQSELVTMMFDAAGVTAQTRYIGWVDTRLYAQVIDIFVDSFPFPCGVTALQAIAAGKPAVFFDSRESRETGVPVFVLPALDPQVGNAALRDRVAGLLRPGAQDTNWLMADSEERYGSYVDHLIEDEAARARVGQALKRFVETFLQDAAACGESYQRHIVEIIETKIAAAAGTPLSRP